MTVNELIELLQKYPAGLRVVVNGYEEGYDDLSPQQISIATICLNTGVHLWQGRHGDPSFSMEGTTDEEETVDALVLRRESN